VIFTEKVNYLTNLTATSICWRRRIWFWGDIL